MFEKIFSWQELVDKCGTNQEISIISNKSNEKRGRVEEFYQEIQKKCGIRDIILDYNTEKDSLIIENTPYNVDKGIKQVLSDRATKDIIVNISTMNLRLLGALLKYVKYSDARSVYCLYTEPKRYARNKDKAGQFDLPQRLKSHGPISGYVSTNVDDKPAKWIPFLGFEGDRALTIKEEYEFDDCVPVITLPSFKPVWQTFIIRENLVLLDGVRDNSIHYVEANSIYAAYEEIDRLSTTYHNYLLRVSPFGTKINALGVLLYALTHEGEIDIVYDSPIEDGAVISEDIGETHIFDISEYIQYAREKERDGNC